MIYLAHIITVGILVHCGQVARISFAITFALPISHLTHDIYRPSSITW